MCGFLIVDLSTVRAKYSVFYATYFDLILYIEINLYIFDWYNFLLTDPSRLITSYAKHIKQIKSIYLCMVLPGKYMVVVSHTSDKNSLATICYANVCTKAWRGCTVYFNLFRLKASPKQV